MSHLADSRVDGIFPLQHLEYKSTGWDLQLRASIFGVRVKDRLTGSGDVGHWLIDDQSVGDINGGQLLKQRSGQRDVPMWRFATPCVVVGGKGTGSSKPGSTQAGSGGGGFNGVPPQFGVAGGGNGQPAGVLTVGIGGGANLGANLGGNLFGFHSGFATFQGVRTNFSNGSPQAGATFSGVRTNFTGTGRPN